MTHHPNSTVTQKFQHFCLVTKLSHVSQFLSSLFAKMMDPPTDTTQKNMVAIRVFKLSSTTTNGKPFIHNHQPSSTSTTTNGKSRNPQPQPPPPTTFNTTTTALNQMCLIEKEKKKKKKEEASGLTALQPSLCEEKKKKKETAKRRNQSEEERKKKRDPNHSEGSGLSLDQRPKSRAWIKILRSEMNRSGLSLMVMTSETQIAELVVDRRPKLLSLWLIRDPNH